jgi:putative Mg2+ transporter-C (MgtC) family protein
LTLPIVVRLLLAAFLGGAVGLEREFRRKPAGLRTNMFICVGSALFTVLSMEMARGSNSDPGRIAAQIITGIGFLGAGAILRERGGVVGLTTAATIFIVAAIGMAAGMGLYATASFTALGAIATLSVLGWVEERFSLKTRLMTFRLTTAHAERAMNEAQKALARMQLQMLHFQVLRVGEEFVLEFDAELSHAQQESLLEQLGTLDARCEVIRQETVRE